MRILICGGWARSLVNFRGHLIRAMREAGHDVIACAAEDDAEVRRTLMAWDVEYTPLPLYRASTNPFHDMRYFHALVRLMRREKPDLTLGYTHKPVLFGALAAALCGVPRRAAIVTGLGYAFNDASSLKQRVSRQIVKTLYRLTLPFCSHVFFQNPDDLNLFRELDLLRADAQTSVIAGSGVDLVHFQAQPLPEGPPRFLLIARLLREKGIEEYARAARNIRAHHPDIRFDLVGPLDPNPAALTIEQVQAWVHEDVLHYLGEQKDVRRALAKATVFVLPSYREGTPRTVLEAMATGRPIITTDVPGCRQTIEEGVHGILVPPRSSAKLEDAMLKFINDPILAPQMGAACLKRVREIYDVNIVNANILNALELCGPQRAPEEHNDQASV